MSLALFSFNCWAILSLLRSSSFCFNFFTALWYCFLVDRLMMAIHPWTGLPACIHMECQNRAVSLWGFTFSIQNGLLNRLGRLFGIHRASAFRQPSTMVSQSVSIALKWSFLWHFFAVQDWNMCLKLFFPILKSSFSLYFLICWDEALSHVGRVFFLMVVKFFTLKHSSM